MRKYTREDIARAYNTFELPIGTALAGVMLQYRQLAAANHPDKFFDPAQKKKAEDKMKKINHAKDVLKDHFKGLKASHVESADCICRPTKTTTASNQERVEAEKRAAAAAAAAESKKKAAEAAAKQAATKAAEEALKKAEAEKAQAEKAAAEEAARRAAQAAADALATATLGNKAAESIKTDNKSGSTGWLYAKACAAMFLGIMSVTCVADLVKGHHSNLSGAVTPGPQQETRAQENEFYRKEADRTAYDFKHRYDRDIEQCLAQIADDNKRIDGLKQELERLKGEPASIENENKMRWMYSDIQSLSSCWKTANSRLDALAQQHPEVADLIPRRTAPPNIEAPELVPVRARSAPTENQRATEKT